MNVGTTSALSASLSLPDPTRYAPLELSLSVSLSLTCTKIELNNTLVFSPLSENSSMTPLRAILLVFFFAFDGASGVWTLWRNFSTKCITTLTLPRKSGKKKNGIAAPVRTERPC